MWGLVGGVSETVTVSFSQSLEGIMRNEVGSIPTVENGGLPWIEYETPLPH